MASPTANSHDNTLWTPSTDFSSNAPGYLSYARPIVKSAQDDRSYRIIRLPNNLEAVLVSDPETDKAAASLNVGVGHLSDPEDRPGLAHFCEHLLFMGTKQFPKENEYGEYVSKNGGRTNAYTSTNNTNYYFSVSSHALRGALERFSTFFHSPLFSSSCTVRELQAVDSENKKNQQSDLWRGFQLDKGLSREGTRWAKFGSGNWESLMHTTLAEYKAANANGVTSANGEAEEGKAPDDDGGPEGREVRRILLDWYEKHYSANRMSLAIYGKESLDELAALATELFSPIPNRNLPALYTPESQVPALNSPWGPAQEGSTIFVKSVMDLRLLEMRWIIPTQSFNYKHKPSRLITHLLGHESSGSILSVLKSKGWANHFSASRSAGDIDNGFDFIRIMFELSESGVKNYLSVIRTVNDYVSLLLKDDLPAYLHDELKRIDEMNFRFSEKSPAEGYVTRLAEIMAKPLAREDLLSGSALIYDEWTEEAAERLRGIVRAYMRPEQARVTLMLRDGWEGVKVGDEELLWKEGGDNAVWEKEKWYGTEYVVRRTALGAGVSVEGVHIPKPNEFIPTKFDVEKKEVAEPLKRPLKIREAPLSTLWFKKDDQFWVPRGTFTLNIKSPLTTVTPRNTVLSKLFVSLVTDALVERTYDADLAGMSYSLSSQKSGIQVLVTGYSDKLAVVLYSILSELKAFVVDPERFAVIKEQQRQNWENSLLEQPYYLSEMRTAQILRERSWNEYDLLEELQHVTTADVQAHIPNLLSRNFTDVLIHGNFLKDDAMLAIKQIEELLGSRPLTLAERMSTRTHVMPQGVNYVYDAPVPNKSDVNSSLTYYCQVGDPLDRRLKAVLSFFGQIAREPSFDQLRTKEQLGYIVASGYWVFTGVMGFKVTIQSERGPAYLESRVDAFFESLRGTIESMSQEEFDKERQSLIDKKLTKLKNLGEEAARFASDIQDGYQDFLSRELDVEILKTLTKDDILTFLMTYIHPSSPTRSKLSIHLHSQTTPSPRVSLKAASALLAKFQAVGVPVELGPFNAVAKLQLSADIHQKEWRAYFEKNTQYGKALSKELVDSIVKVARQYPVVESTENGNGNGAATEKAPTVKLAVEPVYIDDVAALKARMTLGKAAIPVENWSDLGSKL